MFVFTHLMIGKYFAKRIVKKDKAIKKRWFLYGCIYPDISKLSKVSHNLESTEMIMADYLQKAVDANNSKDQSFYLGIVSHYLEDYFCKVHGKEKVSAIRHFLYEAKLHLIVMKLLSDDLIISSKAFRNLYRQQGFACTGLEINRYIENYYRTSGAALNDCYYSMLAVNQMFKMIYHVNILGIIGYPDYMKVV